MSKNLIIKVCGMKYTRNRREVEKLQVDLLGYIFYPFSQRYVGENPEPGLFHSKKSGVGVFVDENVFEILALSRNLGFEWIQMHGKENPKTCLILKNQGLKIIKAFAVDELFDFSITSPYEGIADYFLFDTKTNLAGGSGQKFDWKILNRYKGNTPFMLSGGIQPADAAGILQVEHPQLAGVDLNSGFEDEPGVKNIHSLRIFLQQIKTT